MAYNTKAVEEYRKLKKEAEERSKTRALQKEATSLNSELNAWLDESAALNNRYNTWYKEDGLSKSDEENETAYSQAMQSRLNLIRQATELKNRLWQNEDYYGKDTVDKLTEQIDSRIHGSTDMMDAWADNRMNLDDYRQVKEAADEAGIEIADPYVFYMNKHYGEESIDLTYPEYARQMTQLAPRLGEAQRQFESEFTPVTQQDVDDAQAALDRAQALFDEAGDPYAYLKDTNGKNMVGENGRFITVSENLQNARNTLNNTKHQFEEYTEKSKWSDGQKMDYVFGKRSAFTQQNEQYLKESNLSGEQQVGYLINQGYSWEEIETIAMDMNAHDVVDSDQLLLDYVNRVNASDAKAEMLNDLFDGNPLVDTAVSGLSLLTSLAGGVIAFGEDTVNQLQGDELDVGNSFGHFLLDLGDSSRQAVAMDIGDDHPIAQWLYMNGMSFLDSAAAVGIGTATGMPSLTLGIMGTGSAARTIAQGKERGLSDDQAYASGFMSGLAEVVFENVSLENLGSLKKFMDSPTRTVKDTIKKLAIHGGVDGSEEVFTDIANLLSDQIINGDRSELMSNIAAYEAQGISEGQAIQNALKDLAGQLGSDFLGGFLSGTSMASGTYAIYTVNNLMTGNTARSVGRMLNMSGDAASVANFALDNINRDSADYRAAQSLLQTAQEGGELSASQTGKVLKAGIKAYRDNVSGRIAAVLENDMPSTQAKAMANKLLSGEELSAGETGVVLNDAVVRSVVEQALGVTVDTTAGAQSMRTALSDAAGNAFSLKNLLEPYTVAKNAAPVSNEAQTVQGDTAGPFLQGQPAGVSATGQEVTVTGIGRTDGNGSVQMSLSDGTQMDLADLEFENPAVKELVVAASEYPTAAARAFTSGYDGSIPLSLYHSGFDYLYQQAINGMPLEQAVATSGEIGQMLSPQVQYLAYTAGRNVAEGAVDENGLPQSQNGVTMEENAATAPAFGQEPRREWAKGGLVSPRQGSVAAYEQQVAADYGVPSFVVQDSVWDQYKKGDAFTTGGQIYLRETIDEDKRGRVAAHEINHVMRQVGFEPYLAFLDALPDMLDAHSKEFQIMADHVASHIGIDPLNMADAERNRLFDELNATIYGYIATDDAAVLDEIRSAFVDWDGYIQRIQEIHREFKERDARHGQEAAFAGMAKTIESNDGEETDAGRRRTNEEAGEADRGTWISGNRGRFRRLEERSEQGGRQNTQIVRSTQTGSGRAEGDSQEGENAGGEGTYGTVQEVLGGTGVSGNRGRLRGVGEGVSLQQGQPAVVSATGQEVTVTGIGRTDGNGSVQMSLSDGTQMDLADLEFENPAVKELVVVASEYPTAAARAFTSGYDGSTPLSLYHSGFDYLYRQAINGMPLGQAVATSGEIGQMLSPQVQYLAYTAGRNVAEGTFEDTYASSSVERNDLQSRDNGDMIENVTEDAAQPTQDDGGDGDGPSEDDLENSRKNIREFANGRKKFDEVIDDYAKLYAEKVNSNKHWSWRKLVVGGNKLTKGQRQAVKMEAIAKGYIPDIKIIKVDGMKFGYADFESAGVVKLTMELPESMWKKSDSSQFKWLDKQIGGHIEGYTWHHTEIPGKMQLVPRGLHNITAHNGGRTKGMWASGKR